MGCHFLLQGIFPTQGRSPHLLQEQAGSLPLSHLGSPVFKYCSIKALTHELGAGSGEGHNPVLSNGVPKGLADGHRIRVQVCVGVQCPCSGLWALLGKI